MEVIPNWTPVTDFLVANPAPRQVRIRDTSASGPYYRDKLFICNGRGDHGAVTEMRYGLKAWISMILPYHSGANRIWSLYDPTSFKTLLFTSFPLHTEILQISGDLQTVEQKFDPGSQGVEVGTRTLLVGILGLVIVQVTSSSVITTALPSRNRIKPVDSSWALSLGESIVEAAFHSDSASLVMAVRKNGDIQLNLIHMHVEQESVSINEPHEAKY